MCISPPMEALFWFLKSIDSAVRTRNCFSCYPRTASFPPGASWQDRWARFTWDTGDVQLMDIPWLTWKKLIKKLRNPAQAFLEFRQQCKQCGRAKKSEQLSSQSCDIQLSCNSRYERRFFMFLLVPSFVHKRVPPPEFASLWLFTTARAAAAAGAAKTHRYIHLAANFLLTATNKVQSNARAIGFNVCFPLPSP